VDYNPTPDRCPNLGR